MATPEEQAASMIANMPEKTGKPLENWLAIVAKSGAAKHGEIVKLLKGEHGMTHGFANLVAHKAREAADGGGRRIWWRLNIPGRKKHCAQSMMRLRPLSRRWDPMPSSRRRKAM